MGGVYITNNTLKIIIAAVIGLIGGISSKKIGGIFLGVPIDSIFYGPANIVGDILVTIGNTTVVVILAICGIIIIVYCISESSRY